MDLHLVSEHSRYAELRRRLIEADPEIDETTLLDTLEGATNLNEAIGEVIRAALEEEALADRLKDRMGAMRERLERIEAACANKREVAQAVMEDAGIEKILEPDFTVSLRVSPPSVAVVNEAEIASPSVAGAGRSSAAMQRRLPPTFVRSRRSACRRSGSICPRIWNVLDRLRTLGAAD